MSGKSNVFMERKRLMKNFRLIKINIGTYRGEVVNYNVKTSDRTGRTYLNLNLKLYAISDVTSVVEETGEIQKVEIKDERPSGQLLIQKTDAEK